jgi:hypothetical protein
MISPISQLALTGAFVGSKLIFTLVWLIIQPPGKLLKFPYKFFHKAPSIFIQQEPKWCWLAMCQVQYLE